MKKINILIGTFFLACLTMSFVYQNDWVLVESKGYKILFPRKPDSESQTLNSAIGEVKMDIRMYEVPDGEKDDNYLYGVIASVYPDSLINSSKKDILEQFFRNSIDGAVNNVHGKLLTESKVQLGGFPGRKFRISVKDGIAIVTMRAYLVRNTLYLLQIITDTKKEGNKSADKFLDSFTLK